MHMRPSDHQAQQEAAMRGLNAGYVEFTHSARHGRESLLALLIPHAVVNRDVTLYLGEQRRWLSPPDIDCTAWAITGDERCVLMHQSFEFARIDPDAVDMALLAPVFPQDLSEAETEAAEREDEQRRRAAAMKVAQEHTLLRHPVSGPTGTNASPAFRDVALRGTNTTPWASRGDHGTRGGSNQNTALAFSVATGRRVQCPTPTSLEVHVGSPDELYALLEYFPRLTSLRLHDDAQMDIADIAEYLSETLTSLDIHGWADHDYLDFDTERPHRACISTLPSALGLTNLRVLKLQCPTEGRCIPPVIRGLLSLEELVITAWGLEQTTHAALPALAALPRLRTLELNSFDIGSPEFRDVAPQLKRLETLKLTAARLTPGTSYDWVELLPSLRRLEVEPHPYHVHRVGTSSVFDLDLPSVSVVAPASSSRHLDRLGGGCPPDATLNLTLPSFPVQDLCGPSSLHTPTVAVNETVEAEALAEYCVIVHGSVDPPAPAPMVASESGASAEPLSVALPTDAIRAATALLPAPLAVPWAVQITRLTVECATAPTRPQFRSLVECRGVKHLSLFNTPSEHDTLFVMAGMPLLETVGSNFHPDNKVGRVQRMHSEPLKDLLLRLAAVDDATPYARAAARLLLSDTALVAPQTAKHRGDDVSVPVPGQFPPPATCTTKKGPRHAATVAVQASARAQAEVVSADPHLPPRPPCAAGLPLFRNLRSLSVRGTSQTFSHAVACRAPHLRCIVAASANDMWLRDIAGSCPGLTSLEVHDSEHVTSAQYRFLRHLPLLDTVRLHRTTMGDEIKAELTDSMMWLREVDLHYLRRPRRY